MPCRTNTVELCTTCHRKVIPAMLNLDPAYVWSLGVSAPMEFAASPVVDPGTPPVDPGTALIPISVGFDEGNSDPLNVNLVLRNFNPATEKPPVKLVGVYARIPVPEGADLAYYTDPANDFPFVEIDLVVADPSQPTRITLSYAGPEIFDPRRYQILEAHAA